MKSVRTLVRRKLGRGLMLAAVSILGALGVTAGPAVAATLSHGDGGFTATTAINPLAVHGPCATYSNYQATVNFPVSASQPTTPPSDQFGSYSGTLTANVKSAPGDFWGEFADGTHSPTVQNPSSTDCAGTPSAIKHFTGTLVGGTSVNCSVSGPTADLGTYLRGGTRTNYEGLDITFTFTSASGSCAGVVVSPTAPLTIKTSIVPSNVIPWGTECDSPIAPQSCVLGPASF